MASSGMSRYGASDLPRFRWKDVALGVGAHEGRDRHQFLLRHRLETNAALTNVVASSVALSDTEDGVNHNAQRAQITTVEAQNTAC
jgi:hypothetical protein